MERNDPADLPAAADRIAARDALAPALRLWLVLGITWGVVGFLLLVDRSPPWEQGRGVAYAIGVMTVGLWPGVVEEVAFRGVILQRLRTVCGASFAVAVQAMMFALLRDSGHVLPQFAFGCLAGALRLAGRALWPGVLMHVVGNAALVIDGYGGS